MSKQTNTFITRYFGEIYLYFNRIKESGTASNQRCSWDSQFRNGVVPALVETAGSVTDTTTPNKMLAHGRMVFPPLELFVRTEERVLVV